MSPEFESGSGCSCGDAGAELFSYFSLLILSSYSVVPGLSDKSLGMSSLSPYCGVLEAEEGGGVEADDELGPGGWVPSECSADDLKQNKKP